jgi:predicted exporter
VNWPLAALTVLCLLFFAGIGIFRLKIDTDIISALPGRDPVVADARAVIRHHPNQDRVVIDLGLNSATPALLVQADAMVEKRLRDSGLFSAVGMAPVQAQMGKLVSSVWRRLPELFTPSQLERQVAPLLTREKIHQKLEGDLSTLYGLAGIGQAGRIAHDPLGVSGPILARLAELAPTQRVKLYSGKLLSLDERHLLLFANPAGPGTDTRLGRKIADLMAEISKELDRRYLPKGHRFTLTPMGAYRAAVDNETAAKADIQRAISLSTIGIALLLLFAFPRPLMGLLALLPAVAGTVMALFACSLLYGALSILTIGFGGAIISITVDQGIAYLLFLDRPHASEGRAAAGEIRSAALLSTLTTMGAFFTLLFSGFPILAQIGVFAGLGIGFSFLFVHTLFPRIIPWMPGAKRKGTLPLQRLVNRIGRLGTFKYRWIVAATLCIVMALFARPDFHVDLRSMSYLSPGTRAAEHRIRETWGDIFSNLYLMSEGKTPGDLQRTGDRLLPLLEAARASGEIRSGFLPALIYPGKELADRNFLAWKRFWTEKRKQEVEGILRKQSAALGFSADAFAPFFAALNQGAPVYRPVPENLYDILGISRIPGQDRWIQFATLTRGKRYDPPSFFNRVHALGNVKFLDPRYFSKQLGALLSRTFLKMFFMVAASVMAMLLIFLRNVRLTLLALAPIGFSLVCTLGTLTLVGHPLDFPALMLSIVVIGMGVDYSIFFIRSLQRYGDPRHEAAGLLRMAVFLAATSTLIGFGSLSLAAQPLLRSAGLPSFLGIAYALFATFLLVGGRS